MNSKMVLVIAIVMILLMVWWLPRQQPKVTVGVDAPMVQTDKSMDNPDGVNAVRNVADQVENKTPSQAQLSTVSLTVSGTVYGHLRSGSVVALQGASVRISGVTGATAYSDQNGAYSVSVTAYSDGERVYLLVRCSREGFHTADAATWINLGGAITIPGLQ
ncbi:MAG: hypothetical protein ACPLZY_04610, partial [Candidatus Norongarragalinales archaeon]